MNNFKQIIKEVNKIKEEYNYLYIVNNSIEKIPFLQIKSKSFKREGDFLLFNNNCKIYLATKEDINLIKKIKIDTCYIERKCGLNNLVFNYIYNELKSTKIIILNK